MEHGSVVAGEAGNLTVGDVAYTWDAAGRVIGKGDWTFDYGANGQLTHASVRDYDPRLSQFLTPDPMYFEDLERCQASPLQCSLYGYAGGNPISFIDPTGTDPLTWIEDAAKDVGRRIVQDAVTESQHRVRIVIDNHDISTGAVIRGFDEKINGLFEKLESTRTGANLVTQVYYGPGTITIRPSLAGIHGGVLTRPANSFLPRGDAIIEFDATVKEGDVQVFDQNRKAIDQPLFLILGHELIHALHILTGEKEAKASRSPDFTAADSGEEQKAISAGQPSENMLRKAYHLPARRGDGGRDLRENLGSLPGSDPDTGYIPPQ